MTMYQKADLQAHVNHSRMMSLRFYDCISVQDDAELAICPVLCTITTCKGHVVQTDVHAILMKTVNLLSEAAECGAGVSQASQ